MANKVSIGIDAQLDAAGVKQGIDKITQHVSQANKQKLNPVDKNTLSNLDAVNRKFQELLKVNRELNRRVNATGQSGALFENIDFSSIFPNQNVRDKQINRIRGHVGLAPNSPGPGIQPHPGRPGGGGSGGAAAGIAAQAAQAGLRAAGPAGGVAAGALGTGMSAGFGAGLMGLLGGMLALGVGKLVSGVMEKVDQAENNNVALDKLKRTLGDVNVSFEGLKAVVNGGAENLKITYAEAGKLATQFAKLGNVKAGEYTSLSDELGVGVGLSRSFGLDPSEGVGVMGQMRGVGVTKDTQDSKRFALLIGETIAKSDAFSKADEVISAIGSFATSQTRNNMGAANVSGYAGAFSGLVSSGIAGLDPSGAGALLGRINASLSAGGAKGEASQYFTGTVGMGMGLNPYQTKMLREGGAFATNDSMFGEGSAYARYKGRAGPRGGTTFMQASIDRLRKQYGDGSDELADATANHLGIGINQAMALLSVKPKQMGEMSKYANITSLNASGIGNLSKVVGGTDAERQGVANSLLARKDVSEDDKSEIKKAMGESAEVQKQTLARIVSQYDQEQTTGKDVRDSKNALDNIKTSIADKLVPYFNEARMGIMAIAGVGTKGKTTDDIMRGVIEANSKGRQDAITGQFAGEVSALNMRKQRATSISRIGIETQFMGETDPKRREALLKEWAEAPKELAAVEKRLTEIQKEKSELLDKENAARKRELEALDKEASKRMIEEIETTGSINPGFHPLGSGGAGAGRGSGADLRRMDYGSVDPSKKDEAMRYFMSQGWTKEQSAGLVANLWAESKMRERAVGDGGQAEGIAQWHPDRQAAFERMFGKKVRDGTFQEQLQFVNHELTNGAESSAGDRLRGAKTAGEAGDIVSRYYERPAARESEAANRGALAEGIAKVEIVVKNEKGQEIAPSQIAKTRVQNNWRPSQGY